MTSDELFARAAALEALAGEVEVCLDGVRACAASPAWECDNATDVRGQIDSWRAAAQTAAGHLRDTAASVRSEAWRIQAEEEAARLASQGMNVPR